MRSFLIGRKCDGRLYNLQAEHKDDQGQHSGQAARREQALGEEVRCKTYSKFDYVFYLGW